MKIFGIISLCVILGFLSAFLDSKGNVNFLDKFIQDQILTISATIIAFNIASVIFLIGHLTQLKGDFSNAIREIKDNLYFCGTCFILLFFSILLTNTEFIQISCFYKQAIIMTFFWLMIYCIYEILEAIFLLDTKK